MVVQENDFDEWLENPVTRAVMRMLRNYAGAARERFLSRAWVGGYLNSMGQIELQDLKARSEFAEELAELSFRTFEEFSGNEQSK